MGSGGRTAQRAATSPRNPSTRIGRSLSGRWVKLVRRCNGAAQYPGGLARVFENSNRSKMSPTETACRRWQELPHRRADDDPQMTQIYADKTVLDLRLSAPSADKTFIAAQLPGASGFRFSSTNYGKTRHSRATRQAVNWPMHGLDLEKRRRKTLLKTRSRQRIESKRGNKKPAAKSSAGVASASRSLQAEGRRSTAASLLRSAPGWCGDDLDEIVRIVTETRSKARF